MTWSNGRMFDVKPSDGQPYGILEIENYTLATVKPKAKNIAIM
jgi:hypothetical protein